MRLYRTALIVCLLSFTQTYVTPGSVEAQTAGQITEDSYSPPAARLSGSLVFSGKPGLAPPRGADQLSILIAELRLTGALPGTGAETEALRARLTGRRIAVSEIFAAASALEAAYAKRGYVLARVVIPAQELRDGGVLRLQVISGFVEKVDSSAVAPALRPRLERITAPLVKRRDLRMEEIERRLLLAGDTFGIALGSALSAGREPGGTVVILNPEFRSLTGFIGFDNSYSKALGPLNVSAGLEMNGYLGRGEVIYLRGSGHPDLGSGGLFSDQPRLRTLAAGAVMPLGHDGLTVGVELANSATRPESAGATTASEFNRASLRLFYPLRRSLRSNLSLQASLDFQEDQQDLLAGGLALPLYHDRSRVLRLTADAGSQLGEGASVEGSVTLSLGLDGLGARNAAGIGPGDVPLSRAGADADFRKLEVSLRYSRPFGEAWAFTLFGRAQSSFGDPLFSGEQLGLTSGQALSAFDQGALSGDSGWALRGEISRSFTSEAFGLPLYINPYLFAASGRVTIENPTLLEPGSISASAYGLGADLLLLRDPKFSTASLRVEYGKGDRNDDGKDSERFTLTGSFRF